jgi:endonuclease/exonuclease/phosphatase family metal-dependent hydrolase
MNRRVAGIPMLIAVSVLMTCTLFDDPLSPEDRRSVRVMTRNLYIGTEIDVADIDPARMIDAFFTTDFTSRARGIADEIIEQQPDLVGLQEVALVRIQSPSDPTSPATTVLSDYLKILLARLGAAGERYRVASTVQNADIELPVAVPNLGSVDLRITDRDVILVREGVRTSVLASANFEAVRLVLAEIDGLVVNVPVPRGYQVIEAQIGDTRLLFANTHLETRADLWTQSAQGRELLDTLDSLQFVDSLPLVLVGDFNSPAPPFDPVGGTYLEVLDAGYTDIDPVGPTCCHPPDLRSDQVLLERRIDFVFTRQGRASEPIGRLTVTRTGASLDDRIRLSPIGGPSLLVWPSDHAGVAAGLRIPKQ